MIKEQKFYRCNHCGNMISLIEDRGVPVVCCGEKMTYLVPNTVDASQEKHIPQVEVNGNVVSVQVGSVMHPSTEEHNIKFIYLQTEKGGQRKNIVGEPKAQFVVVDDTPVAVFEYCNLHGLWKTTI